MDKDEIINKLKFFIEWYGEEDDKEELYYDIVKLMKEIEK